MEARTKIPDYIVVRRTPANNTYSIVGSPVPSYDKLWHGVVTNCDMEQ